MVHMHQEPFAASIDITNALNHLEATGTVKAGEELTFAMSASETDAGVHRPEAAGPIEGELKR